MNFCGIEKSSLVDFGDKLTCTVFTHGCNFKCPFCHNAKLVQEGPERDISDKEVFDYLVSRRRILDAVCVSGGEPTLHPEIREFLKGVKQMGLLTNLDTNGTNPDFLIKLIEDGLVDYVAMDIKNCFSSYGPITGTSDGYISNVKKSVEILLSDRVDYEFRTTLVNGFHTIETVEEMAKDINGAKRLYLQKFVDRGTCLTEGLEEISEEKAMEFLRVFSKTVKEVKLRGY